MKRIFVRPSLVLFLTILGVGFSNSFGGSKTGADFLKIPIGARSIGMGQAYSALAEDADALNWNVAGMVPAPGKMNPGASSLSLSHQEMFFGNNLDHLSFVMPHTRASLGLSITRLSYPDQVARDADRNETGSFGANDLAVGAAMGMNIRGIRLGSQLKFIKQDLAGESASGWALDLGLLSRTPISKLTLGAAVQNLGPALRFIREDNALPLTLSLGVAYHLSAPLTVAVDLRSLLKDHQTSLSVGTEFSPRDVVTFRAGYLAKIANALNNSQTEETNRGTTLGLSGMNAGIGIKLAQLNLDYALSPFGELGDVHSFTLSTAFGGQRPIGEPPISSQPISEDKPKPTEEDRKIMILDPSKTDQNWWDNNK